jgi:hypothetical protein
MLSETGFSTPLGEPEIDPGAVALTFLFCGKIAGMAILRRGSKFSRRKPANAA